MRITIGDNVTYDREGRHGVFVVVDFDEKDPAFGRHIFSTHGMSPDDVTAEIERYSAHHAAKAARHATLATLKSRITLAGNRYEVTGCVLQDRGTDVELVVRLSAPGGKSIEMRRVYPTIGDVPSDGEIASLAIDAATAHHNREKVAGDHANSIRQAVGGMRWGS